jgi:hypothetical protein
MSAAVICTALCVLFQVSESVFGVTLLRLRVSFSFCFLCCILLPKMCFYTLVPVPYILMIVSNLAL